MKTDQNLRIKLTLGYILLIAIFSLSIFYILQEVKSLNVSKEDISTENTKVIQLSGIISDLYATENIGRLALLSYNKSDAKEYHSQSDSLIKKIESFKENELEQDDYLKNKLDTIIDLINLKTLTFDQVLDVQSKYARFNVYENAKSEINEIQSTIKENTVEIDTVADKLDWWGKLTTNRAKQQQKRLQLENEKVVAQQKNYLDSLNKATETVLLNARNTQSKLLRDSYVKEKLLIKRNQTLTNELREILIEVEKIILKNSALKYEESKGKIDDVSQNIANIGIVISIIALIFGFIILRDLNKSVRNKQKLEKLNKDMQDLIKQKSFFMATISHDMVSPINSLMGFSSLLQNLLKTAKQKEFLKHIIHSTQYIKKMVDDLSLFSNLEYNKIKIKKGKFNFSELLENILINLKNSAERKNVDLTFTIDPKLNSNFNSDAYRIQQILTNVISNAIKFTHKGSVTIDAKLENNQAKITVIDTGIGIKVEDKDTLFAEFVQVHDDKEGNYGGSGLGLNITKRLINLLKGNISFESEFGKGTIFYITIPLAPFEERSTDEQVAGYAYDNARKLQNKKILVIDDDLLQLKLIEEILGNKVKKLTTVENGNNVKEILQQEQYNLVITDMQMPFYSGIKVIKDIRSLENYKDIPVIALTGKIDFDEYEYKNLGFNFYMSKPININTLYNNIYKLLRIKNPDKSVALPKKNTSLELKHADFDLTDLFNLLENDNEAIKQILDTFFTSARTDVDQLQNALKNNNIEQIKQTAHKMLPMFRQLQIIEIVEKLVLLEQNVETLPTTEIEQVINLIADRMPAIVQEIQKIIT